LGSELEHALEEVLDASAEQAGEAAAEEEGPEDGCCVRAKGPALRGNTAAPRETSERQTPEAGGSPDSMGSELEHALEEVLDAGA